MLGIFRRLNDIIVESINYTMSILSLLIISLIIASALLRYVFMIDFYGMEDLVMLFAISLYFIGSVSASYTNDHIHADVVSSFVQKGNPRNIAIVIRNSLTVVGSLALLFWSINLLSWSIETRVTTQTIKIPLYLHHSIILLSFILMAVYECLRWYQSIIIMKNGFNQSPETEGI